MNLATITRQLPFLDYGAAQVAHSQLTPAAILSKSVWSSPIGFPGLPQYWTAALPTPWTFPFPTSLFSIADINSVLYGHMRRTDDPTKGIAISALQMGLSTLSPFSMLGTSHSRSQEAICRIRQPEYEPADLPSGLSVHRADILGVPQFGVFAKGALSKGIRFGPFRGKIVQTSEIKSNDDCLGMWEVFDDGKLSHYLDGKTQNGVASWMSLVQCARHPGEQNMEVVQHDGEIYYQTTRDIDAGTELLVWYGTDYDRYHGIPTSLKSDKPPDSQQKHQEEAGEGQGFSCERCGKMFTYKYYLDKHLKFTRCVDLGNRGYPCPICERSFEKRDRLRIHILHVHEKYKPHVCAACGKAFSQSSSLNKHIRVHTGVRPYRCVHCAKTFTASSILRTHIRQHSGEKPFKCKFCGKSFASHAAHDSHVRRTHSSAWNNIMADQHPYRHDPDSEGEEEEEEQVVFAMTKGKAIPPVNERVLPEQETTYYLGAHRHNQDVEAHQCGLLCLHFPSLSRYATLSTFIIVLTVLCCFQGMFYAFWISIITSIEKQYELSSAEIGLITALGEIGKIVCLLGLSFCGELAHRPRWIAISSLALTLSYIFILIPDLFAPDSSWKDLTANEVCHHPPTPANASTVSSISAKCLVFEQRTGWRVAGMTIFAIAHFVSGCASAIPIMYGVAMIQDHFVRKDSSLYLGVHFVGRVLGPVLGFLLGTLCTATIASSPAGVINFGDQDPRWLNIRAWHVTTGILVIALLNIGAAFPMLLFPPEFTIVDPESKPPKGCVAVHNLSANPVGYRKPLSLRMVKEDVKKLVFNQMFMTRVATVVINVFVLSGFYVFLPKYLEAQFYAQPNVANIATAIAVLLPTGCGIIVGCFLYRYCDFKPKHSTLITMLTSLLFFVGFLVLIAFRCDSRQMAGMRTSDGVIDINQPCNSQCSCDDPVFSPVCDVTSGLNYYSACRAGCGPAPATNSSHAEAVSCHCAAGTTLERLPKGFCRILCNKLWPFVFLLFLILFSCSVPTVGSVMLIYRTVPTDLMLMAHIFMATCVAALALFPSPLVFGGIIDSSCLLWSAQGCSDSGACLDHDNNALAFRVSGTISGMKVLAVLIEIYMFWKSRQLEFDEIEPAIMWSPDAVRLAFTETVGR
ncbi:solute carrier organic anion transporter family member 2A1-like [Paramacrobiotus metropolitanus]|uniref:solute carrier organic anion transporter family member 2A1-like n=1 Tax=Paramacrobiotus metropolitanus TaxID=2943436 RepID=UPI002445EB7C|nr:solute carrier organic anion transporter family member 2A1-like [Paramacrobiotus metropolitanus]